MRFFPHAHGPQLGGVTEEAAFFNQPLRVYLTAAEVQAESFFQLYNPAIVLETVKKAENSEDLILRLYEFYGAQQTATLTCFRPLKKVFRTDLLESNPE